MKKKYAKALWIAPYLVGLVCYLIAPDSEAGTTHRAVTGSAGTQNQPSMHDKAISARLLPSSLTLDFSWEGLSPTRPENHDALSLQPDKKHYRNVGTHQVISYAGSGKTTKVTHIDKVLPIEPIQQLFAALDKANWKPAKEPASVIEHTDDYPYFSIVFTLPDKRVVKLSSTSNTHTGAPWNLQIGQNLYVTQDQQLGTVVSALYKAVS